MLVRYYIGMSTAASTITVKRNNDLSLTLTVTDKATGNAIDITDYSFHFAVKKDRSAPDEDALFPVVDVTTHTDPTAGKTAIPINADDTKGKDIGKYYYDILMIDADGKRQSSKTGDFVLAQEVTDADGA